MVPGDSRHNKLEMAAEREAWIRELSDGDRMSFYRNEGMSDAEIIAAECERYGIVAVGEPLGAWALLRHIYNNRDAIYGMKDYTIRLLQERLDEAEARPYTLDDLDHP